MALEEIRELLTSYASHLDTGRIEDFAKLFAKDAEWIGPRSRLVGRRAIHEYFTAKSPERSSSHVVINIDVKLEPDCERASVQSEFLYVVAGENGEPVIDTTGHYEDVVERRGDRWRFVSRIGVHDMTAGPLSVTDTAEHSTGPADEGRPAGWTRDADLSAEDRLAVQDLIASYALCLDTADVAGWVDNFMPDGILQSLNGTVVGHQQLRHWVTTLLEFGEVGLDPPIMVHVVGLPQIRGSRDRCIAKTYCVVLDYDAARNVRVPIVGYYVDTCVRSGTRWRFERRVIKGALDSAARRIRPPYGTSPIGSSSAHRGDLAGGRGASRPRS